MPYWAARISLLKSLNPRIAGHSIGAGPLRHVESRAAARVACAALTTISVRDRLAQKALAACTSRPIDVVPDPAFMLEAAPRGDAIDLLRNLDLTPGRPLIVVSARRWFHSRGGFVPNILKAKAGIGIARDEQRFELLLDMLVDGLTHLARRLEAAVLLLPSYNVAHEGDDAVCEALVRRLGDVTVRMSRIADPQLYKAVLGHASLIISSRMHPLILGAGMGVPLVSLSYNDKFQGLFDQLGMAARPLPLDDFPGQWGSRELIAAAEAALAGRDDLRHRAELLGTAVQRRTLEVAFADMPGRTPEVVDA
jgi:polysaccharide pyruvyl transferase WcaK-like protein